MNSTGSCASSDTKLDTRRVWVPGVVSLVNIGQLLQKMYGPTSHQKENCFFPIYLSDIFKEQDIARRPAELEASTAKLPGCSLSSEIVRCMQCGYGLC